MFSTIMQQLKAAAMVFVLLTILTGLLYPLLLTGAAQAVFPNRANGSLIKRDEIIVGSHLIGQDFREAKYFWGRPSATMPPYNAASSSGSNLGPSNPDLFKRIRETLARFHHADPGNTAAIPVDLVSASGSGLDPHISPAAALYQVPRIARARGIAEERIREMVQRGIEAPQFGILGEPRVNVLELNLELDKLK